MQLYVLLKDNKLFMVFDDLELLQKHISHDDWVDEYQIVPIEVNKPIVKIYSK